MHSRLRRHLDEIFGDHPDASPHLKKLLRKVDEEYRRADGDRASLQHALGLLSEMLKRPPEVERRRHTSPKVRAIARLFDQAPFAAVLCDPDRKVTAWNGAAETLLGIPAAEAVGRELSMLIFPDTDADRAQARSEIRELIDSGEMQELVRATPVRGQTERTCEWTIVPLRDRDGVQVGHAAVAREVDPLRERYAVAWEGSGDGIWDWNLTAGRLWISDSWRAIVGAPAGEEQPSEWLDRIHPGDREAVDAAMRDHLEGGAPRFDSEHRLRHADGSWRWVLVRGQATRDATGKAVRFSGSMMDVTGPRAPASLVLNDPLTHLPNRGQFLELVKRSLGHARRDGYRLAVVLVDVDRFKSINERLGHGGGDEVLVDLAGRLQTCLREGDALARPAADEFAVLLDEVNDPAETQAVAKRIHEVVSRPFAAGEQSAVATVSIGVALSTPAHSSVEELLLDADAALHRAKAQGGARTVVFDAGMRAPVVGLDSARGAPAAASTPSPSTAEPWTTARRASRGAKR